MNFKGSTLNVSPLCQGCELIYFADQNGIMFHQCEICKNKYQNIKDSPEEKENIDNTLAKLWMIGWIEKVK